MHKCKFSTFIIIDGYRRMVNINSIKVIISLNLSRIEQKNYRFVCEKLKIIKELKSPLIIQMLLLKLLFMKIVLNKLTG